MGDLVSKQTELFRMQAWGMVPGEEAGQLSEAG